MDLLVAIGAFFLGALAAGGFAWVLATARGRAMAEALRRGAEARASGAEARAIALGEQALRADARAADLEAALREADSRRAAEAARVESLTRNLEEQTALLDAAKTSLQDSFQTLAGEALRASQEGFLALAAERLGAIRNATSTELEAKQREQQKSIEAVLGPVRASLEKVDEHIRSVERERGVAYGALRQQLAAVTETQERLSEATRSLVGALKAPAVRGQWGEMQLRRVVELAGMVEHCDFVEQATFHSEDGRLRPDMVIRLPGGREIVVDAKVPLSAYLEAREAQDEELRSTKLRQHAAQVQAHIGKLAAKSYWEALTAAPEMVVMFLPGEPLYSVALEQMPGLIEEGFARGVLVATPTTLLGLLRAVSAGWREERLAENAQRISEEGRKLHERIATLLGYFGDLGHSLNQSVKHFNRALGSINSRVVVSARRLEDLDAKGKKSLPEVEEIEVRAATPPSLDPTDRPARLPRQTLKLALGGATDET